MTTIFIIFICAFAIISLIGLATKNTDPFYNCPVNLSKGCSYVDGPYCDSETCEILKKFKQTHIND